MKRLNEREVNNTQIEICWDITWFVNRKKYFCLFSERKTDKQDTRRRINWSHQWNLKATRPGLCTWSHTPRRHKYRTQPKKFC